MNEDVSNSGIEVILVRMEGKLDRMSDRMDRYERDVDGVRKRLHDLSNEVTPIHMLDLPARFRVADQQNAMVDTRLQALEDLEMRRKGAATLARIMWTVVGVFGAGGIAAIGAFLHAIGAFK